MRSPDLRRHHLPFLLYPDLQRLFDQLQQTAVGDPLRDQLHELAVRDAGEVRLEVDLDDAPSAVVQVFPNRDGRLLGVPLRPVAVGAVVKVCLKDGLHDEPHSSLDHTIFHRCDPERSRAPFGLGYLDHSHGRKLVALLAQRLRQFRDHLLFLTCVDNGLDRHPIDTGRPLVRLDLSPSFPEDVRSPDLVIQTVKPLLLVLLGCAVEGSLQFPDVVCSVGSRAAIGHPKLL